MSLFWTPQKNFMYSPGFRHYNRASVLFTFKRIKVKSKFIIRDDKCDLFIPGLTLKEMPIKYLKFKRIIKKEILPPSQGYRTGYVKIKHYLYLVSLKLTAPQNLKKQINEWFNRHKFVAVADSDDSDSFEEYSVIRK